MKISKSFVLLMLPAGTCARRRTAHPGCNGKARARMSRGEQPKRFLNARLKCAASLKPQANAISLTLRALARGSHSSRWIASSRCPQIQLDSEHG